MYINQAIEKAAKQKRGITRTSWMPRPVILIPTNTLGSLIVLDNYSKERPSKGWQPFSDDLTANDWIPYG